MKDKLSEIANLSKNLLLELIFNPWLCVSSPRTSFKPRLTVRNLINSPVLSPTLLQIYCIRLIGSISYSFWVWPVICDATVTTLTFIILKNHIFLEDILLKSLEKSFLFYFRNSCLFFIFFLRETKLVKEISFLYIYNVVKTLFLWKIFFIFFIF